VLNFLKDLFRMSQLLSLCESLVDHFKNLKNELDMDPGRQYVGPLVHI